MTANNYFIISYRVGIVNFAFPAFFAGVAAEEETEAGGRGGTLAAEGGTGGGVYTVCPGDTVR